jgi:hypothetical protein
MYDDSVPALIAAAGEPAVRAYREFLDDPKWSPNTRKLYRVRARRFFRWAEARGLTLKAIDTPALAAYADEIARTKSRQEAPLYLTPVRGALGHLARSGVLASDPCPKGQPNGRGNENTADGSAPAIPLGELTRIVRELDNWEDDSEFFQAGLVVLAPLSIGTMDPAAVAAYTGVPEPQVREYADRLLANGVWRPDGAITVEGEDPETGEPVLKDLDVILGVLIAIGHIRCQLLPDGEAARAIDADGPPAAPGLTSSRSRPRPYGRMPPSPPQQEVKETEDA